MMLILTGEKGSGKTTLIRNILLEHKITAQGFLSVKEMQDGRITGISLLILPENRTMPMAVTTAITTDMFTGRYYFYPGVFDRVNNHFRSIKHKAPFIFDEFGILEMEGKGHYPIFSTVLQSAHSSLIVVRKELVNDLLSILGDSCQYRVADMSSLDLPAIRSQVTAFLQGVSSR